MCNIFSVQFSIVPLRTGTIQTDNNPYRMKEECLHEVNLHQTDSVTVDFARISTEVLAQDCFQITPHYSVEIRVVMVRTSNLHCL